MSRNPAAPVVRGPWRQAGQSEPQPGTGELVRVHELQAGYGRAKVLFGVSVRLAAGRCVTLLGANGVGKTTLLRAISGLVKVDAGSVTLGGREVAGWPAERIVRAGIAHVPQGRGLFPTMTVHDNLRLGGFVLPRDEVEGRVAEVLDLFPQLKTRLQQAAGQLSGGEQQMVAMMRALVGSPRVLLLDEPTLGLSPLARSDVMGLVAEATAGQLAVLLVEQNARKALEISDECYVMRSGRIVVQMSAAEALSGYERLADAYLGAAGQ